MNPIKIQDVVKGNRYIITDGDEPSSIIIALTDGDRYPRGDGLSVQYVDVEVDEEGKIEYNPVGKPFDLFPGTDTETSNKQRLYNIKKTSKSRRRPRSHSPAKTRRRPRSHSLAKSKKGGSRKSKKGTRR
jgi:hypothetical protein